MFSQWQCIVFVIVFSIQELNALCSMRLCRNFTQYIFRRDDGLKCPYDTQFFLRKYLAYHMYKPIPIEEKFQKAQNTVFRALKCSYFILKMSRGLVTNYRVMT